MAASKTVLCAFVTAAVSLRSSMHRDRNIHKRPHSLVSITSSSSSSASSGSSVPVATGAGGFAASVPAAAVMTTRGLQLGLSTMHESPLETASFAADPGTD